MNLKQNTKLMNNQSFYIVRTDTNEFYVSEQHYPPRPRFYHSPTIAKKNQKSYMQDRAKALKRWYPNQLAGVNLEVIPSEKKTIYGDVLRFHVFTDRLYITRRMESPSITRWNEIYNSDLTQSEKWAELIDNYKEEGSVQLISPGQAETLSEGHIIGIDVIVEDRELSFTADSRLFWFPDLQTQDELEYLDQREYLIFTRTYRQETAKPPKV